MGPSALSTSQGTKPPPTTPWPMAWDWLVHDPGILLPVFQEPRPDLATPTVLGAQTDTQPPPTHTPNDPFELVLGFVDGQGTPEMPSCPVYRSPEVLGWPLFPLGGEMQERGTGVQTSAPIYKLYPHPANYSRTQLGAQKKRGQAGEAEGLVPFTGAFFSLEHTPPLSQTDKVVGGTD